MDDNTPQAPTRPLPVLNMTPQAQFEIFQLRHRLHLLTQLTQPYADGEPAEFYVKPEDLNYCFANLSDDVESIIEEMSFELEGEGGDRPAHV